MFTKKGYLAIRQPEAKKIESVVKGGIALVSQRVNLIEVPLLLNYELDGAKLQGGKSVIILKGDAGFQEWAKKVYTLNDLEFVLCPEAAVIGYKE